MELAVPPRAGMRDPLLGKGCAEPSHWPGPSPGVQQQAQMTHVARDSREPSPSSCTLRPTQHRGVPPCTARNAATAGEPFPRALH